LQNYAKRGEPWLIDRIAAIDALDLDDVVAANAKGIVGRVAARFHDPRELHTSELKDGRVVPTNTAAVTARLPEVSITSPDPCLCKITGRVEDERGERSLEIRVTDADAQTYVRSTSGDSGRGSAAVDDAGALWTNLFRWLACGEQR
jgi:hypothetical protein